MTSLFTGSQWNTSPTAYWTIQYEYQRSGADMQYRFYWKVWLGYSSSYYNNGLQLRLFINGVQNNVTVKAYGTNTGWSYEGTTGWYTVSNKTSGTTPFYAVLYDTNTSATKVTSSSYNLAVSGAASVLGTIADFDVDNGVSIPITKYNSGFTDTLVIKYSSATIKTISGITNGAKVVFTSAELTIIYDLMSSVNSGTFTFELTTKNGSTTIGSSSKTAKGSISGANPTFDESKVSYFDTNSTSISITGNRQHIVQNQSLLTVNVEGATGNKGARIVQYILTLNGKTEKTGGGSVNFGRINSSQDVTLTVSAKDSRGNETKVNKTITILAYTEPTATVQLERLNNYEVPTSIMVDASISSVNGKNTMSIKYRYKEVNSDTYGEFESIDNNTPLTKNLPNDKAYTFNVVVTDAFGSTFDEEYFLNKGVFPLFIDTQKNAVGINDFPAENEALRVSGGVAKFIDGIVLCGNTKNFLLTVDDSGTLKITEM